MWREDLYKEGTYTNINTEIRSKRKNLIEKKITWKGYLYSEKTYIKKGLIQMHIQRREMYRKKLTWKSDLRKMETYIKRIFIKNHI